MKESIEGSKCSRCTFRNDASLYVEGIFLNTFRNVEMYSSTNITSELGYFRMVFTIFRTPGHLTWLLIGEFGRNLALPMNRSEGDLFVISSMDF